MTATSAQSPPTPQGHDDAPVALERIVGDLDDFDAHVLHQRPQVRDLTGVTLHRLLSLNDVDAMLTGAGLRTPFVSLVDDDRRIPEEHYQRRIRIGDTAVPDLVHPGRVLEHVGRGATLILQGLQRYWPPVAQLCRQAEQRWAHACHANAYLTPPHARGFAEHTDGHDTLLIQTHGVKQWTVAQRPGGQITDLQENHGQWTLTLTAPAALYLPAGVRHAGVTCAQPSLHVTIGISPWTWQQAAHHIMDMALASMNLPGRLPAGALTGRTPIHRQVTDLTARLADTIRDLPPDTITAALTAGFIDKAPPPLSGQLQSVLAPSSVTDLSRVARRPGALATVTEIDDAAVLVLGDRRVRFPLAHAAVLRHVLTMPRLQVSDLAEFLPVRQRTALIDHLIHEGLLVTAP
ncbi:JmjC domain-containing protein [Salinispora arenicola]|uniref:JmjC domain-containing protein n=1 Tax=Salinispora arenicola TaxID=168697 RepID=UPI000516F96E|nr:cupin domain-containing protein [Salinispora arenicola]